MKRLILILILILLAACQPASPTSLPAKPPAQAQAPGQGSTPTAVPTRQPTSTPFLADTATPTPVPSPTMPPCLEQHGSVERYEVSFTENSPALGFRVYLPPCFGLNERARYPVLYMIHGQSFTDDQWVRLGIAEAADTLITQHQVTPFIIVMPHEKNTYADIFATPFRTAVVDGLVPWIDGQYPTCARRECRAIGGLSRGGAWALHFGFTRWELFGAVGLHSTPPFIGDPDRFPGWLKAIPAGEMPRLYLDTGRHDYFIKPTTEFEALLVQLQVPHEWYLFAGTHNEEYWSAHVLDYLWWYTQPWQEMRAELSGQ